MGYIEAVKDNIPITVISEYVRMYYPPCCGCGKGVMSNSYIPDYKYTCQKCKPRKDDVFDDLDAIARKIIKEKKLKNAIKRISKVTDIEKYSAAIKKVERSLGRANWFQSTEEIMVALELIKRGIKAHHQVRIRKYTADFVLPDDKVVLEIDGSVYHTNDTKNYESRRDDIINLAFGLDWEVIRISTSSVNKNITKLYPAIKAIQKQRKILRENNKGILPKSYSIRRT